MLSRDHAREEPSAWPTADDVQHDSETGWGHFLSFLFVFECFISTYS